MYKFKVSEYVNHVPFQWGATLCVKLFPISCSIISKAPYMLDNHFSFYILEAIYFPSLVHVHLNFIPVVCRRSYFQVKTGQRFLSGRNWKNTYFLKLRRSKRWCAFDWRMIFTAYFLVWILCFIRSHHPFL